MYIFFDRQPAIRLRKRAKVPAFVALLLAEAVRAASPPRPVKSRSGVWTDGPPPCQLVVQTSQDKRDGGRRTL